MTGACLNCGAALHGPFCSECGQRALAALPTVKEMLADTWHELSGYDGRFIRTLALLLRKPGALTLEVLAGRRARYIAPVRLYLVASVVYFLLAAAIPRVSAPPPARLPNSNITIDLMDKQGGYAALTPEEQQTVRAKLRKAPWPIGEMIFKAIENPKGFQSRMREILPRVFFVLVPVFAAIVAAFFWRRRFSQHLVFALHLHAALFVAFSLVHLTNLSRSAVVVNAVGLLVFATVAVYAIVAFRRVYGDPWVAIVGKIIGIALVYSVATFTLMVLAVLWVALITADGVALS